MPVALLKSQLETLEVPQRALEVDIALSPDEIVNSILSSL